MPASSYLAFLWLAGAACLVARAISGRVALAVLRRRSSCTEHISGVEVRTADVATPVLTGLRRPAILVPASACGWTPAQRQMVLLHELTHFRRLDCWSNLLAQTVRAAFWFHPVVWLLAARMSREQELACDQAVVDSGHSPHDYAAFLLDTARALQTRQMFVCAMAGSGAHSLKERFAQLLDARPRPTLTRLSGACLALFAAAAVFLAVVHPVWSQNQRAVNNQRDVYQVGGDILPPTLLTKVEPQYTPEARAAKISGPVYLTMVVTPEGKAEDIEVVSGLDPGLDLNAIDAISQWTFQPAIKNGQSVAVTGQSSGELPHNVAMKMLALALAFGTLLLRAQVDPLEGLWQGYDGEWGHVSRQLVALAKAIPAEKYAWRPAAGVRSTSEVFMHIVIANFGLLAATGPKLPPDLKQDMEKTVTAKADVIAWLERSLDAVKTARVTLKPADYQRKVRNAGRDATVDGMYLRIIVHANEHMGQLVAYARMNGIVPPWSS